MRVVHVIGSLADRQGGPSAALVGLALAQFRQGLDVAVLTGDQGDAGSRAHELKAVGIPVTRIPAATFPERLSWRPSSRVASIVAAADILHVHGVWEHILFESAMAAKVVGKSYVIRPCGMLDTWALQRRPLKKRLYLAWRLRSMLEHAAAIHCTTRMESDSTCRIRARLPRIIVEPNGILGDEFVVLPCRGGFREAHGIGDRPLIVFLGRVHPGKGVEYLLRALPLLKTSDVVVAVVGPADSEFAMRMRRQAASLSAESRVIFTGMLRGSERIAPLVDADVFALPSEHENFGISVIEALAAGCPVVVSDQVGLCHEVSTPGVGSVATLSPTAIAGSLDEWLQRRLSIQRPFVKARRFALDAFDWKNIATRWHSHYVDLAGVPAPPPAAGG